MTVRTPSADELDDAALLAGVEAGTLAAVTACPIARAVFVLPTRR